MKQLPIHIKVKFKVCQKTFQIIKQRDAYHTKLKKLYVQDVSGMFYRA